MNKVILVCLLLVAPTAFAATCNNPLATVLSITAPSSGSQKFTALSFCKGLIDQDACCSADVINGLQGTIDTVVDKLIVQAAARDAYLLTVQTALSGLQTSYNDLGTKATSTSTKLGQVVTTSGYTDDEKTALTALKAAVDTLKTVGTSLQTALKAATDGWSDYQSNRADCIDVVTKAQASVYCLACRAAPDTGSVASDGTVTYDATNYIPTMAAECKPYVTAVDTQNALTQYYKYSTKLSTLSTLLDNAVANPKSVKNTDITAITNVAGPTDDAQEVPDTTTVGCADTAGCLLASTVFLNKGAKIDVASLGNGGAISSATSKRVLAGARMLAAYNPSSDTNAAGVTVAFPDDPIAYLNSAWRQGGLMTCVVALVAMLLF